MDATATPRRPRLIRRLFLLFNLGMAGWFLLALGSAIAQYLAAESEGVRTGTATGAEMGMGALLLAWLAGGFVLGGVALAVGRR